MKRSFYMMALLCIMSFCVNAQNRKTNATILESTAEFVMNSPVSATMKVRRSVRVDNAKGKGEAVFVEYEDSFRSLTSFSGKIVSGDRTVARLKRSDISSVSAVSGLAGDTYALLYEPNAPYPYVVEYEYVMTYRKGMSSFPAFFPVSEPDVDVVDASYKVSVPKGIEIQYVSSSEPLSDKSGKTDVYIWDFSGFDGYAEEHMMPSFRECVPYVYVGPKTFTYAGIEGSQNSWKELGEWLYGLQKEVRDVPQELRDKVLSLVDGVVDDRMKIRIIYDFLRENTRYVSIQLGIGGLKPFPVSTVFKTGFGDCKALSIYMQALLDVAGIRSEYFIVHTSNPSVLPGFCSAGQMNHAMLCVPMPSDTLWLECTNPRIPLGYRHEDVAGHQVVIVKEDGGELVRVPSYPDSLRFRSESMRVRLEADGSALCDGMRDLYLDNVEKYLDFRELKPQAMFDRMMSGHSLTPTDFKVLSVEDNFDDFLKVGGRLIPWMQICYTFAARDFAKVSGDRIYFSLNPFSKRMHSDRGERVNPMEVSNGWTISDTVRVELPEGYVVETLPPSSVISTAYGTLTTEVSILPTSGSGNAEVARDIMLIQSLTLNSGRFPKEAYAEYRAFAKEVSKAYSCRVVLRKE